MNEENYTFITYDLQVIKKRIPQLILNLFQTETRTWDIFYSLKNKLTYTLTYGIYTVS